MVVGYAYNAAGFSHGFRFDPRRGQMEDVGALWGGVSSGASGINNRGEIVGAADSAEGLGHAVKWDPGTGRLTDLGVLPGSIVSTAEDINDRARWSGGPTMRAMSHVRHSSGPRAPGR